MVKSTLKKNVGCQTGVICALKTPSILKEEQINQSIPVVFMKACWPTSWETVASNTTQKNAENPAENWN